MEVVRKLWVDDDQPKTGSQRVVILDFKFCYNVIGHVFVPLHCISLVDSYGIQAPTDTNSTQFVDCGKFGCQVVIAGSHTDPIQEKGLVSKERLIRLSRIVIAWHCFVLSPSNLPATFIFTSCSLRHRGRSQQLHLLFVSRLQMNGRHRILQCHGYK